jgi:hypothetical protein
MGDTVELFGMTITVNTYNNIYMVLSCKVPPPTPLSLNLGLPRHFKWLFMVADMELPI